MVIMKRGDRYLCQCDCGIAKLYIPSNLGRHANSCGCLRREIHTKHGLASTSTYRSWQMMVSRCNGNVASFNRFYKARGIKLCRRWESFACFLEDMGEKPTPKHQIDRINTFGNYEPGNCRWATKKEQANNMRSNVWFEFMGEKRTLAQWAEVSGLRESCISRRVKRGWEFAKAITTPAKPQNNPAFIKNRYGGHIPT